MSIALVHERCGLEVERDRKHDCIDVLKAEVKQVRTAYGAAVADQQATEAKLDAVRRLPEKWRTTGGAG